ncbi:MAG: hypothetical protein EPO51_08360 [Phenylobacterium sp.]|uniref:MvdC/MvdD family ATP grasp protein n=1 Tax=Phenylobacterium sp. TaxID=1871053 RepID=UPI0011F55E9F|nr:hypothetical protein [Phenylobacterium sp.]TAJ72121.1 MAG: hypothetical protein EPO51_08360 [Phenylobacterium sp.]
MTVLIITNRDDVHADLVIPLLEGADHRRRAVRLNTEDFLVNCPFELHQPSAEASLKILDADRRLEFSEVTAVWYRKPPPVVPPDELAFPPARGFAVREAEAALRTMFDLLEDRYWMSPVPSIRRASQKLPNLKVAADLGFTVPPTLVTNRPAAIEAFARRYDWNVLAKPFTFDTFQTGGDRPQSWDTFAARFDAATFEAVRESVRLCPVIVQPYVEKALELRATLVGREVFCTALHSQEHADAREDWRAAAVEEIRHEPFALPAEVEARLLAFNDHFGLNFSAVDLILDPGGRYVWLEANPNGQWRWLEDLTGQPISNAIAAQLAQAHA